MKHLTADAENVLDVHISLNRFPPLPLQQQPSRDIYFTPVHPRLPPKIGCTSIYSCRSLRYPVFPGPRPDRRRSSSPTPCRGRPMCCPTQLDAHTWCIVCGGLDSTLPQPRLQGFRNPGAWDAYSVNLTALQLSRKQCLHSCVLRSTRYQVHSCVLR